MVQFLANLIVLQKYFEFIPLKKDRCRESYIARIFQYDCLISKSPDQAVAAVNLRKQRPSSVLASVSYPEATTIQLIVGDAVSSGRGNGKKSREPRTSETIILNDGLCASITLLFSLYRIKSFTTPRHYSFKKCSQYTCIFTLQTW